MPYNLNGARDKQAEAREEDAGDPGQNVPPRVE